MKTDVKCCARCGQDHDQLEFTAFTEQAEAPIGRTGKRLTHFATCPTYNEPILMCIVDEKS